LSQFRVDAVAQDKLGFIWFGTQYGLNRYDGYKSKVFKHEPGHPESLSCVYVRSIFVDHGGTLWVGCAKFLDRFVPATETFTHYRIGTETSDQQSAPIERIREDRAGALWLATDRGLYRFDPATAGNARLIYAPRVPTSVAEGRINEAEEDREGRFWVAEASNGREAIEMFRTYRPDVTLMDLQMPEMSGIDGIIAIRSEFPQARIIVLTTYAGDVLAKRALKAGAQAYVLKGSVRKDLLDTIRLVHGGKKRIHPEIATQLADHSADDALTSREIEVLSLIAAGNSNKIIADQLAISEETVKGHIKNILSKLSANDRTHAVTLGLRRGIFELPAPSKES
jgi:DNA-binding NarL/FixJ family response regulator